MSTLSDLSTMGQRQQKAAKIRAEIQARESNKARGGFACGRSDVTPQTAEPDDHYRGCGPVGQGDHVVGQGDCISSIAVGTGYFWETIWDDPANTALKHARKNPNALLPGDRVTLPAKKQKYGSGQTEMRHRFVRRGEPTWLVLKLIDETGTPRPQLPYTLVIDGNERAGITDGDGRLREPISGRARQAVLRIEGEDKEEYRLKLGAIDPAREVSGIQARLRNLGYGCGPVDGKLGPRTLAALNRFRADVGLPTAPHVDEPTLARLEQYHDQMESSQRPQRKPPAEEPLFEDWVQPSNDESALRG